MMSKQVILSPSLLSSDFGRLYEELAALEQAGLSWVHMDIMDGIFVPNITFGPPIIAKCRQSSSLFFDVHLMIERPERYLSQFIDAGADLLCVHAEASLHLERTVSEIARLGARPAVALNPHTPLNCIEYVLPQLFMVLIMSVNPGFGGQSFIPFSLQKIQRLKSMIKEQNTDTLIQVDGGITPQNSAEIVAQGANVLVSGSAFFKYPPYEQRKQIFLQEAQKGQQLN